MDLISFLTPHLRTVDLDAITTVQAKTCRDFDELVQICRRDMTVTDSIIECLAISFAVHLAIKLDGDPLWMYMVGAPSSGKSTLCELLGADEINTRPLSKFTGLVSGSRQGKHLAPKLNNKCVVIKDGTLLLESTPIQLQNVYGELRDIYDGSLEADYRNGVSASFSNISFGLIIGITEKVYSLDMSSLGERFLHVRLETNRGIEQERNRRAIDTVFQHTSKTVAEGNEEGDQRSFPFQRQYVAGFLQHLHNRVREEDVLRPSYTEEDAELIQALADVVACSRASAPRDMKDNILYESRPEASTRVVKQLSRLALGLCYVLNTNSITPWIRHLITKTALDTCYGRQYHIIKAVATSAAGLSPTTIASTCDIPLETCRRTIKDMESMKVFINAPEGSRKGVGRKNHILSTPNWIESAFRRVEQQKRETNKPVKTPPKKVVPGNRGPKRPLRKKKTAST